MKRWKREEPGGEILGFFSFKLRLFDFSAFLPIIKLRKFYG